MLIAEACFQNTHSVASVTEPDSTKSPYDGHFTSNSEDTRALISISKCFNNFSEVVDKA